MGGNLLSKIEVAERLNMRPATVMRFVRQGAFPKPIRLGGVKGAVRWREEDIEAHILGLVLEAKNGR